MFIETNDRGHVAIASVKSFRYRKGDKGKDRYGPVP
jgi:hypothetical protein